MERFFSFLGDLIDARFKRNNLAYIRINRYAGDLSSRELKNCISALQKYATWKENQEALYPKKIY
jgi:hypothetical protein